MRRAASEVFLSALFATLGPSWQASPETCSAAGGGRVCKDAHGTASRRPGDDTVGLEAGGVGHGAVEQEVAELRRLIELSKQRLRFLEELETAARGLSTSTETSLQQIGRSLQAELPVVADLTEDAGRAVPTAAAEDYLLSKAVVSQEEPLTLVEFLPLQSPGTPNQKQQAPPGRLVLPSTLLVAVTASGIARLFSPSGALLFEESLGHEQVVTHLAVSPAQDLHMIATCDVGGLIRVHKIVVRHARPPPPVRWVPTDVEEEKPSIFLDGAPAVNVTMQFMRQVQVPFLTDDNPRITALAMVISQGSMYLAAGDEEGKVSVFARGGAFLGKIDTTSDPGAGVDGLRVRAGNLLFWAGAEWGYISLPSLKATHVRCPELDASVAAAAVDPQMPSRVILADTGGFVWVLRIRNRTACRVERRFPGGGSEASLALEPIKDFVLALERARKSGEVATIALNMTPPAPGGDGALDGGQVVSPVVWRRRESAVRDWAVYVGGEEHGSLLAVLSGNGFKVEILEVAMNVRWGPEPVDYWDFLPLIVISIVAVVILVILLYCYLQHRREEAEKLAKAAAEAARKAEQAEKAVAEAKRKAAAKSSAR